MTSRRAKAVLCCFFLLVTGNLLLGAETVNLGEEEAQALHQGHVLYGRAHYEDSASHFRYVLTRRPGHREANAGLALTLEGLGRLGEAGALWTDLSMQNLAREPELLFYLGRNYLQQGDFKTAKKYFLETAKLLEPAPQKSTPQALEQMVLLRQTTLFLALSNYLDGDFESSLGHIEFLENRLENASAFGHALGGLSLAGRRQWGEAIAGFGAALREDATLLEMRPQLARIYGEHGDFNNAYLQLRRYLQQEPEDKKQKELFQQYGAKLSKAEEILLAGAEPNFTTAWPADITYHPNRGSPPLTVGLWADSRGRPQSIVEMFLQGSSSFFVSLGDGTRIGQGAGREIWQLLFISTPAAMVAVLQGNREVMRTASSLEFVPTQVSSGSFLMKGVRFAELPQTIRPDLQVRGSLSLTLAEDGFRLVNRAGLEEYLLGVLPYEIGAKSPVASLAAQAVLARSYALWRQEVDQIHKKYNHGFDLCDSVHCQVYKGVLGEAPAPNEAVKSTWGVLLERQGRPFQIWYHASCGGLLSDGKDWDIPKGRRAAKLPSVLDSFKASQFFEFSSFWDDGLEWCFEKSPRFAWMRFIDMQDIAGKVKRIYPDIGALLSVAIESRSEEGRVQALRLTGSRSSRLVEGDFEIRQALAPGGLRSSLFSMLPIMDKKNWRYVLFMGRGYGHGRGACQVGMIRQGQKDKDFKEILKFYYPDADLVKRY